MLALIRRARRPGGLAEGLLRVQSRGFTQRRPEKTGETWVGKSRLTYEFTHSHRVQEWLILEASSVSYGKCPRCQHENEAGAKFCEECAATLARACGKCGRQLSPTATFCPECAHPTGVAATPQPRPVSPESYTPKHPAEKILTSKAVGLERCGTVFADNDVDLDALRLLTDDRFFAIPTLRFVPNGRIARSAACCIQYSIQRSGPWPCA